MAAFDNQGNNILPLIGQRDGVYLASFTKTAYQVFLVASRFAVSQEAARVRLLQKGFLTLLPDRQQFSLFAK